MIDGGAALVEEVAATELGCCDAAGAELSDCAWSFGVVTEGVADVVVEGALGAASAALTALALGARERVLLDAWAGRLDELAAAELLIPISESAVDRLDI